MGNAVRRGGRGTAGKVVLIVLAAVFLLGTIGLVVFGILNSVMLLPYKRQAIYDYYADDANYYDISGVVEKAEYGDLYLNGERCLRLSLDEVVSDKPFIKESGVVEFDLPLGMFDALAKTGSLPRSPKARRSASAWHGTCGGTIWRSPSFPKLP